MKFIKLDRRYKVYKEHNHTCAFLFEEWSKDSEKLERIFEKTYGSQYCWALKTPFLKWKAAFIRSTPSNKPFRYMISMKSEDMATFVLLKM